jgi:transposase-like protein
LAPLLTDALRQRRKGKAGRSWYVDETYIKVAGQWQYLYRAIDRYGNLVDVYLSETRDQETVKGMGELRWASYNQPYVSAAGE